jgi:hypothetical protein
MSAKTSTPLADELRSLKSREAEAYEQVRAAESALKREPEISAELLEPYWREPGSMRRPDHSPEKLRELAEDLIREVQDRGLAFEAAPGLRALTLIDPALRDELQDARTAHSEARTERIAFEAKHTAELRAESEAVAAENFKTAVERGDIEQVREALAA